MKKKYSGTDGALKDLRKIGVDTEWLQKIDKMFRSDKKPLYTRRLRRQEMEKRNSLTNH